MFWQHMANAGLIEGSYTGISGAGAGTELVFGENIPVSRLSAAAWSAAYVGAFAGSSTSYALDYGNMLRFGSLYYGTNTGANLTPSEAWSLDKKLDDGKPGRGKVIARYWNNACALASSNADLNADYKLSETGKTCSLNFVRIF
jgi:hypothetical protein